MIRSRWTLEGVDIWKKGTAWGEFPILMTFSLRAGPNLRHSGQLNFNSKSSVFLA